MKKRILWILLLSLLVLSACGGQEAVNRTPPTANGKLPKTVYSEDLLENWVDKTTFVSAEMLEESFGEFTYFYFSGEGNPTGAYTYEYRDSKGDSFTLSVQMGHEEEWAAEYKDLPLITEPADGNDLRVCHGDGNFVVGCLCYTYYGGRLVTIEWVAQDYRYLLDLSQCDLSAYDLEDGSFLSNLLQVGAADTAANDLCLSIDRTLYKAKVMKIMKSWGVLFSLLTVVIVMRIQSVRHKKKTQESESGPS